MPAHINAEDAAVLRARFNPLTKTSMPAFVAVLILTQAWAAVSRPSTRDIRAASPKEISSFNQYLLKLFPANRFSAPEFSVTRTQGDKKWTVRASIFTQSEHGYKNLCKQEEAYYRYDGRKGWRQDDQQDRMHTVWLDQGTDCSIPAKRIQLNQPLSDVDVIELLAQGDAVLKQAAIMLRGNTECSLVYLGGLRLAGIGTGSYRGETMFEFDYAGGEHDHASLLVRKLGKDWTTWDIRCGAAGLQGNHA
jgi:hypothetical protein